jgi:hypothetical protein
LETPKGKDLKEDVENLAILRSLLAAAKAVKAKVTAKVAGKVSKTKKRVQAGAAKVRKTLRP